MAQYHRHLDTCPNSGPSCVVETQADYMTVVRYVRVCALHQSLRGARNDQQLFDETLKNMYAREAVRAKVKELLALDKEHPGVPFLNLDDGSVTVVAGVTGQQRATLRAAAAQVLAQKPMGFGKPLTVE